MGSAEFDRKGWSHQRHLRGYSVSSYFYDFQSQMIVANPCPQSHLLDDPEVSLVWYVLLPMEVHFQKDSDPDENHHPESLRSAQCSVFELLEFDQLMVRQGRSPTAYWDVPKV